MEKRLGVVDLTPRAIVRWADLPATARLPLELFDWSPDGSRLAIRARGAVTDRASSVFALDTRTLVLKPVGEDLTLAAQWQGQKDGEPVTLWRDDAQLLFHARQSGGKRDDWWLTAPGTMSTNVTATLAEVPTTFRRRADDALLTIADGQLAILATGTNRLTPFGAALRKGAGILLPDDPA